MVLSEFKREWGSIDFLTKRDMTEPTVLTRTSRLDPSGALDGLGARYLDLCW